MLAASKDPSIFKPRKKVKQQGKGKMHSYLGLPHYMLRSEQFGKLRGNSIKLLIELAKEFKGNNNGDLSCSFTVLQKRGWKSSATLAAAKKELEKGGWIICTRAGGSHRCSLYAVTWLPIDECRGKGTTYRQEKVAKNDWLKRSEQSLCE